MKELTVLENIFLGNEITHNGIMDYDLMTLRCQKLLAQVKFYPFHLIPALAI